jgi:hypothetical protein
MEYGARLWEQSTVSWPLFAVFDLFYYLQFTIMVTFVDLVLSLLKLTVEDIFLTRN